MRRTSGATLREHTDATCSTCKSPEAARMTTVFLLALALSMDAFAAAVSHGVAKRRRSLAMETLQVGLAFGTAQALMPLLGWGLGLAFTSVVRDVDHWIAFVLLAFIGARMVGAGLDANAKTRQASAPAASGWGLLTAAVATSIDAAAAGVTLPMLGPPVLVSCAIIGAITFAMSAAGVLLGSATGAMAGRRAEVIGGLVLIGIGTKILIEHLFFGA